jgi:hypothetical protein
VFRETEGNPFFVEEVVKALIEQGEIYRSRDRWRRREIHELTIPQRVKEAVGRRLSGLTETCGDVLTPNVLSLFWLTAAPDGILKERKPLSRSKTMYLSPMKNLCVYIKKGRATF